MRVTVAYTIPIKFNYSSGALNTNTVQINTSYMMYLKIPVDSTIRRLQSCHFGQSTLLLYNTYQYPFKQCIFFGW